MSGCNGGSCASACFYDRPSAQVDGDAARGAPAPAVDQVEARCEGGAEPPRPRVAHARRPADRNIVGERVLLPDDRASGGVPDLPALDPVASVRGNRYRRIAGDGLVAGKNEAGEHV